MRICWNISIYSVMDYVDAALLFLFFIIYLRVKLMVTSFICFSKITIFVSCLLNNFFRIQ